MECNGAENPSPSWLVGLLRVWSEDMARLLSELICPFSCHVLRFFRIIESSESDTALVKEVALPYDLSFLKDSTSVYMGNR